MPPSYNSSKSSSKYSRNQPGSTNELEQVLFGCPLTDGRAGYWRRGGGVQIAPSTPPKPLNPPPPPKQHVYGVVLNFGLLNKASPAGSCCRRRRRSSRTLSHSSESLFRAPHYSTCLPAGLQPFDNIFINARRTDTEVYFCFRAIQQKNRRRNPR